MRRFAHEVIARARAQPQADLEAIKVAVASDLKSEIYPKNAALLAALAPPERTPEVVALLRTRLTRTGSGVTPIALMPPPLVCPGKCTYCPTAWKEVEGEDGKRRKEYYAPKAYTGFEPATRRAIQNGYDAKRQIDTRLSQYEALGQPTSKCELILMGGTFLAAPQARNEKFIHECFDALNGQPSKTLEEAQAKNERARRRLIGLTIETRPDWCSDAHIGQMLSWGGTRVELGVQSLDDEALRKVKRGHPVATTIETTQRLKDAAFKVGYHFMPGMYAGHAKDVAMMRELFENPGLCPDMLKIYPCLVMPGTELHEEWKAGRFEPIGDEEAVERIADATRYFPPWVRVMRMQRDIPANLIAAGVKAGNLHERVHRLLAERGERCRCIRCREVFSPRRNTDGSAGAPGEGRGGRKSGGRAGRGQTGTARAAPAAQETPRPLELAMVEREYAASGGREFFLSFEDEAADRLAGFVRLRIPSARRWAGRRPEVTPATGLVRELHVYGQELAVGAGEGPDRMRAQHQGLGRKLLVRAEEIARQQGMESVAIISGVGVREYYRKLGYARVGPYMGKPI